MLFLLCFLLGVSIESGYISTSLSTVSAISTPMKAFEFSWPSAGYFGIVNIHGRIGK